MQKQIVIGMILVGLLLAGFGPKIGSGTIPRMDPGFDGTLSGYVNNTNMHPIEGALVRVYFHGTYEENYSDASGYYHVTDIPICYCLKNCTASKEGYYSDWVLMGIVEDSWYDFVLESMSGPDLECDGELAWGDVQPGEHLTGSFEVYNAGDPGSFLDWEVIAFPDWGTDWTFDPYEGYDLTPEDGRVTIEVSLNAPEDPNEEYEGEVVVGNKEDPDDTCSIPVYFDLEINQKKETNDLGGLMFFRGSGLFPHYSENNLTFFALRVLISDMTGREPTVIIYRLTWITIGYLQAKIFLNHFENLIWIFGFLYGTESTHSPFL